MSTKQTPISDDQKDWQGAQEIPSPWFSFQNVGDKIKGTLISKTYNKDNNGFKPQWVYTVKTSDQQVRYFGIGENKKGTISRLNGLPLGTIIGVKFEGLDHTPEKSGKKATRLLSVVTFGVDPDYKEWAEVAPENEDEKIEF